MDPIRELPEQVQDWLVGTGLTTLDELERATPAGVAEVVAQSHGDAAALTARHETARLLWRHRWGGDPRPIESSDDPRLDGWYHTIELSPGIVTRGLFDHRSVLDNYGIPESLQGKTALDVGTADGFFAFELERRGASRVDAIDISALREVDVVPHRAAKMPDYELDDHSRLDRFAVAKVSRRSEAQHHVLSVYDLSPERLGSYDIVFCGSLLLHLSDPLRAMLAIRSVTRELAIVETAGCPDFKGLAHEPVMLFGVLIAEDYPGEKCEYWRMSQRALEDLACYAGFASVSSRPPFVMPTPGVADFGGVLAHAIVAGVRGDDVMPGRRPPTPAASPVVAEPEDQAPATAPASALTRVARLLRHPRYVAWRAWQATLDPRDWR